MAFTQRLSLANTASGLAERIIKYGWPLVGASVVSLITGWAAAATDLLKPYAPLSWVVAALIGASTFCLISFLIIRCRTIFIDGSIRRRFYEPGDKINPLDKTFEKRRIYISDIIPPVGFKVAGKTFIDCELIGPLL
jgi:hypothetical protein